MKLPRLAPARVEVERRADGARVLRSPTPLGEVPAQAGLWLRRWAADAPGRTALAERAGADGWRRVSYADAARSADAISAALLARGLGAERPVAVLSGNGIDHALLTLGALQVGIPVAPISPAYSLVSSDHARLRHVIERVDPGLIYVADPGPFAAALAAIDRPSVERVVSSNAGQGAGATPFAELLATAPTDAVAAAFAATGPDSVAKILFTSGSTGTPKGVINTHRMLTSNQEAIARCWPFLEDRPPVLLDWLPWSHTFGANHNVGLVLRNGGTLHIDGGKPLPGMIETTAANLREVSPTIYFNVPRGFDALLPFLEDDAALRDRFFADLDAIFYAGAALPQSSWERLETLAVASRGRRILMMSAWGSTETAPMATTVHFPIDRAGVIGLPAPGTEVALVPDPASGKDELRVRGPNVTPGYWRAEDGATPPFDDEGFLRMGDAGRLEDEAAPERGLVFDGRTAENFKLASGTWVNVGNVRVAAVAALSPVAADAVVTGHDGDALGLLIFPSPAGLRAVCPDAPADAPLADLIARPEVRDHVATALGAYAASHPLNSERIARALLLAEPPSIDANEITDKGYINQRAVLDRRAALVEKLHRDDDEVILVA